MKNAELESVVKAGGLIDEVQGGKSTRAKRSKRKQLMIDFIDAVKDYRKIFIANFHNDQDDDEDTRPQIAEIEKIYALGDKSLRAGFQFTILKVFGHPIPGDSRDCQRLNKDLHQKTYDLLKKLEQS